MSERAENAHPERNAEEVHRLAGGLRNEDVAWQGTTLGLMPAVESDAAQSLLGYGEAAVPALIEALDDEPRFVLAHVLLTLIAGEPYETAPWNGLQVDLCADGTVRVDPIQRRDLVRRWKEWAARTDPEGPG
jgi:hypothetical protein